MYHTFSTFIMACCSRIGVPAINFLFPLKFLQLSTASSRPRSICRLRKLGFGSFSQLSSTRYSSTEMSLDESTTDRSCKYNWIDGAESLEKYKPGGYHPIMIGDMLHERYRIVDKLGFGGYSTVWLAQDTHLGRYVAIKVGIADALAHEVNILRVLSASLPSKISLHPGRNSIPLPLDEFELHGPNGTHQCYTMIPARCNLKEVSFSRLFPIEVTRALSGGLTLALAYTHSKGYVHGDVHLRNVLVKLPSSLDQLSVEQLYKKYGKPETIPITRHDGKLLPPNIPAMAVIPLYLGKDAEEFSLSDARVLLSDFGEAFAPASEFRHGEDCHTPLAMRPPEARFQPQSALSYSADIWSLATTIWEILGMKAIFSSEFATADEVLSQQIDVLGPMPASWWKRWGERSHFFDENMHPKEGRYVWPPIDKAFEEGVQMYRRKRKVGEFDEEESAAILDLMRRMLAFRPEERPTAEEVLKSEWMLKWVLPDFERSCLTSISLESSNETWIPVTNSPPFSNRKAMYRVNDAIHIERPVFT